MTKVLGRPRGFDLAEAIRKAQGLFWRQGFEATSLGALASAVGVHKPSLYAAYGGKRGLYLAAYEAYQREVGRLVASTLSRDQLRDALADFFTADIDLFAADEGRGCFMLATALPLASLDEQLGSRIRHALQALRAAMAARIERAVCDGDLAPSITSETAVDVIMSTHIAIANLARSGETRAVLEEIAARLVDLLCPGQSNHEMMGTP